MAVEARSMAVAAARPKQPYPGLRPFESEEWSIFFGRESMIDDVIERMAHERMVFVHGSSGAGKSSLVRAGVLPKLARQHLRHGTTWVTAAMRPSGGPLWNLARELAKLEARGEDLDRIGEIIRLFGRRGATLAGVVGSLEGFGDRRLCILIDQFEELFRFERETSRDEAELFVDLIVGAVEREAGETNEDAGTALVTPVPPAEAGPEADLHIIITMRSEFLGDCARFDGLAETFNRTQYLVPRMRREALLRAIRRPAELYGGSVSMELAESLVSDVRGREDELPLIQHGLMLMWHNACTKANGGHVRLERAQFEQTGGLAKLLSDHADSIAAKARLSDESADAVERLFRALTDINAEGQAIRRPQTFGRLVEVCGVPAADLVGVIDVFRADGVSFLTPYQPTEIDERTVIDISHEALIRCWDRIADGQAGWLKREFDDGLIWRSLLTEATTFRTNRKHLLPAAATRERRKWLKKRNAPWSERHGGGWDDVSDLIRTSHRAVMRSRQWIGLLVLPVVLIVYLAGISVAQPFLGISNNRLDTSMTVGALVVMSLSMIAVVILIFGYTGQMFEVLRGPPAEDAPRRAARRAAMRSWAWMCLLLLPILLVAYAAIVLMADSLFANLSAAENLALGAGAFVVAGVMLLPLSTLVVSYVRQLLGWLRRRREAVAGNA